MKVANEVRAAIEAKLGVPLVKEQPMKVEEVAKIKKTKTKK